MKILTNYPISPAAKKTFAFELMRSPLDGALKSLEQVFAMALAIQLFSTNNFNKSIIASSTFIGYVLSMWAIKYFQKLSYSNSKVMCVIYMIACILFIISFLYPNQYVYAYCITLVFCITSVKASIMTSLYHSNYDSAYRGKLFGNSLIFISLFNLLCIYFIGKFIKESYERGMLAILFFAICYGLTSIFYFFQPGTAIPQAKDSQRMKDFFRPILTDHLFRKVLIVWFLLGFANLSVLSLKLPILMEPLYGNSLSIEEAAFIIGVIPSIVYLIFTPIMSKIFDMANFIGVRMMLNIFLFFGIFFFFIIGNYAGFITSSIFHGIAMAGANIAWTLWVTKITPPENSSHYMSIHQLLTGVRGIIGPIVAFQLITIIGVIPIVYFSLCLLLLSTALLIPLIKFGKDLNH